MEFDFSEDQHEIKRTAKDLLAKRSTAERVRSAAESGAYEESLWNELAEHGWPGVAISEEGGGGGLGVLELATLLEESGYALANSPFLASAACGLAIQEAGSDEQKSEWLPKLASGEATGSFGIDTQTFPDVVDSDVIVVVEAGGSRAGLVATADAVVKEFETIDPTRRYGEVGRGEGSDPMPGDASAALSLAAVLTSAELVGVCARVLEMTVEYVKDRKQFGRPVGSFQAVQHRCAQMLLHTEGARSVTYYAAWAADADRSLLEEAAALAKSSASKAGVEVTASAIQAHGGIGFTWEADVHWFYKRAQMDAAYLGGTKTHRAKLTQLAAAASASR
ncbi:MAG: acyl-CoA dehydrogenase family protein [Solirubrobacterales bacterium]|nr:acyl-CoA dehydrogenase family protein [Solirubrobacterales bacterium]